MWAKIARRPLPRPRMDIEHIIETFEFFGIGRAHV